MAEKTLKSETEFYAGEYHQKTFSSGICNTAAAAAAILMRQQKVSSETFQQKYFPGDYQANQKINE